MKKSRALLLAKKMRATKRKQIKGRLRRPENGAMCALGFACELYRRETGRGKWRGEAFVCGRNSELESLVNYGLPTAVVKWYGLEKCDIVKIVNLNDTSRCSFKEIALELEHEVR